MAVSAARPPIPPTALIGREGEIARVRQLLAESRLVTLTGPGGTGKTRLALAVLAELEGAYPDGVAFVDLAPLADPALVPSTIVQALGVHEAGGRLPEETLKAFLARRELLLCLDNFEHLVDAAPLLSRLLGAASGLEVLATSRASLRLAGEREHRVPPLEPAEAHELFAARAQQAKDGFLVTEENRAAIAQICEGLDRLPLAIELAAARVRALPPEKLRERLGERLPLLTQGARDAPARQQTLRATIEWSYGLLGGEEQALLARLSVFAGGCTLEAAEDVCDADLEILAALVEQSLLREEDVGGEPRYMLLETVREYALERLRERGEETPCRHRHAVHFLALAEDAKPMLHGPDQLRWLDRLERELDNLRGALSFALDARDAVTAERLAAAFWNLLAPSRAREAQPWLEAALALGGDVPPAVRARTLLALGHVTYFQGEDPLAGELLEAAALGAAAHLPWSARRPRKRPTRAGELLEEAARLFRQVGDDERLALTIGRLLWVARDGGEQEALSALAAEALPLLPRLRTPWVQIEVRLTLGSALAETGDREGALEHLEEARRISLELGDRLRAADALAETGWVVTLAGDYERAQALQEDVLVIARAVNDPFRIVRALGNLGLLAALVGDFARAASYLRENLRLMRDRGYVLFAGESVAVAAACAATSGKAHDAALMAGAAEMLHEAGSAWHATEQFLFDRHVFPERERLGREFDEAVAEGRRFSFDGALTYALESLEGEPVPAPPPATPASFELEPGAVVGGFEVEAFVGRGGMGVVYRARQRSLDRAVALKVLAPALAVDEVYRARFLREARLAAAIEHPNVLPVHEAGEFEGRLFLAVRYVEGEDLGRLLAREGKLTPARAVELIAQIADALDAAHARGLVHRDVKPSNVLVEQRGEAEHALLTDFGVAKPAERGAQSLTATGQLLGTVEYLAPELIEGVEGGSAADVYALGCVLFELLTGHVPFERDSQLATLFAHVSDDPPAPSGLDPALSSGFDEVVSRALAKRPEERFETAGELAAAAWAALAGETTPSIRAPATWPEGLPRPATALIGRERELAELTTLLAGGESRLLTLVGPGGVGKTRLALELTARLAPRFPDGAAFVPFASLANPALVASTIAQALGLREAGSAAPGDLVREHLETRSFVLCLDNLEHLPEAVPLVGEIVGAARRVTVVATSRVPLRLEAEREYSVQPLPQQRAIELFSARATTPLPAGDDDAAVAVEEICARLDGLPLAIELAAARTRSLSPQAILARLDESLSLLTGGARDLPERQRTLRATLDWSHELLDPEEQLLFARFAVFAGGARLDAIEAVCDAGLDLVDSLVAKSLLTRRDDPDGEPRFDMLETIREYAAEKLEAMGETEGIRRGHAQTYAGLVHAEWQGWLAGQTSQMRRVAQDLENVRAAVALALADRDADLVQQIGAGAARTWTEFGHLEEGRALLDAMVLVADDEPQHVWGWLFFGGSTIASRQGRFEDVERLCARSLESFREAGDSRGMGMALRALAAALDRRGEHARARELYGESLDVLRGAGEERFAAWTLNDLGYDLLGQGDVVEGESLLMEARVIAERWGDRPTLVVVLTNLAECRVRHGDLTGATALYHEVITTYRDAAEGSRVAVPLDGLAIVAVLQGRVDRAVRLWGASDTELDSVGAVLDTALGAQRAAAIASAREALGEHEFERLVLEGRAMSLDEAIAYALEDEPD